MELGDWIKKARSSGVTNNMGGPSSSFSQRTIRSPAVVRGRVGGRENEPSSDNLIQTSRDLDSGVILRNNLAFELSPGQRRTTAADHMLQATNGTGHRSRSTSPKGINGSRALFQTDDPRANPPDPALARGSSRNPSAANPPVPFGSPKPTNDDHSMSQFSEKEEESSDDDYPDQSELNSEKRTNTNYMANRKWLKNARREVTAAFNQIPELENDVAAEEVIVEHHFTVAQQIRILARKRRIEDCGVVFCTIDISPSRDAFYQWIFREVEERTAVQIVHVKVLAPRHYLAILRSIEDRDAVLAGGPYYMRKRMIYTTPWEPGFDTHRVLTKKMAVWLDLLNIDPMIEGEAMEMLASLGEVIQLAGVTDTADGKFANIRGCVVMDMTQPLPTALKLHMNNSTRLIRVRYDTLPDACFKCQERGHIARTCPKDNAGGQKQTNPPVVPDQGDGFQLVTQKDKKKIDEVTPAAAAPSQANRFGVLEVQDEDSESTSPRVQQNAIAGTSEIPTSKLDDQKAEEEKLPQHDPGPIASNAAGNSGYGKKLPDLNTVPAPSQSSSQTTQQKKLTKKQKKKERRALAHQALVEAQQAFKQNMKAGGSGRTQESDDGSSEGEDVSQGRLWQTTSRKKTRDDKEVMETQPAWNSDSGATPKPAAVSST
ncbi:hypothetical protein R1sor_008581 [Riccia sorocarpa]|uniref:CCHC-type domain-containing protein n=1 Tax=Riccia sorocarpa TaxID=122646 RepID=A0ABD3HXF5_9MARC